ncbi:mannonate dehydratase [Dyadobacter fermentans]|uniref:mannonate dehydratase n=1 Tax=Dyadobacter fermentans (strain ATCC 700827 / DSM 18053 / CIP 107007 / KCTC 52180 / NS114) TaxID=471854 RepID=C6W0C5_DYAFD|nr:mannonate dehydratase [Dyadobacter fermentans]ACT91859.1 Mannonate dehydratase [Dyadobacter fermentans DSM 18053]
MENSRRKFIKNGAAAVTAAAASAGLGAPALALARSHKQAAGYARDGGMQFCLAHFFGIDPTRIALSKQMNVLGAVGGINPQSVGLSNVKNWEYEAVVAVRDFWKQHGITYRVIEGPPSLYEKTKLGLDGKDEEIETFIKFIQNLSKAGIDTVCYNWMPVISWARTKLDKPSRGGALVSSFDHEDVKDKPLTKYGDFTHETMWKNLEYFLKAVVPEAEKVGVKLALHPDDPPVDKIQGIPRIMTSADAFKRLIEIVPSESNGITLCQGTFATMGEDIPSVIKYFGSRKKIHFVHFRDVRGDRNNFEETFHDDGKTDMYEAMKTYYEVGFRGPMRPDHVPTMAGDSNKNAGYSNYGALFAIGYMRGLVEAVAKRG